MTTSTGIPKQVEEVLATRIDRLEVADRTLLQAAATIGDEIPVAILSAVVDLPSDALHGV